MPIYEYYCAENHTVYQFYAKTLKQGRTIPKCPDNPAYRLQKMVSGFAVTSGGKSDVPPPVAGGSDPAEDSRLEAAARAMESEFAHVDENDPKAMARMMRRMAELSGEKINGEAEEMVRKLEEGADPEALEEQLGGEAACHMPDPYDDGMGLGEGAGKQPEPKEAKHRFKARQPLRRDPKLYDYD
ncbi:MAG: FmdB family transcriptional regulator [Verrucomicrobia bacterium]|nr:FmdB family transcriptional regulator [Verrucomicrobiota bacterium]